MQPRISQSVPPSNAPCSKVRLGAIAVLLVCVLVGAQPVSAQVPVNVWTYHNDNMRTGRNLNETRLTPANVNADLFGKLFSCEVDGQVYAQPLYMSNIGPMPDGNMHNVVFAATQHDSVYAFDADGPNECLQLWARTDFIDPDTGITTVPSNISGSGDIRPELGITATPVIDTTTGTLYVVVKTKEVRTSIGECTMDTCNHYVQTLHALNVTTGLDLPGVGPTVIGDTVFPTGQSGNNAYGYITGVCVPGRGNGHIVDEDGNNIVCFNALREHVRSGLVVSNGVLYVAWASHGDNGPYHGWVIGYDAATLRQVTGAVFNTAPNGGLGGIWMGGGAPAVDPNDGSLYFSTGNGTFAINDTDFCTHHGFPDFGPCNPAYGDTVLKLSIDGGLSFTDYFTPFNQRSLDDTDADLASGGVLLVPDTLPDPHPHLLITAGKRGAIYSVDRDDLGMYQRCGPICDDVVAFTPEHRIANQAADTPAYLNTGPGLERRVYFVGSSDPLQVFALSDNGTLSQIAQGTEFFTGGNTKGATVSISGSVADDGTVFNAIVWATQAGGGGAGELAILRAYDALASGTLTELYDSNQRGLRDQMGCGMKFSVPTVANGKVYVGTGPRSGVSCTVATAGQLTVFGLF